VLGGAEGVKRFQESQNQAQESARTFASVLISQPITALRTLFTDARAAGAGVSFLKAQLDFIINSRFGSIALGFAIFGTIASVIRQAAAALIEFEDKFARIRTLSAGRAGALAVDAEAIRFIQQTARETGIALGELSEKYLTAASATQNIAQRQQLFTTAMQLSKATGADFEQVILLLSGALNTFGGQLGKSVTDQEKIRIQAALLFEAFNKSTGTFQDFVAGAGHVASVAAEMNIPFDILVGLLGQLNDQFIRGSKGGRGLRQELVTLVTKADEFNEKFRLGLSRREIIEDPVRALTRLAEEINKGAISAEKFKALASDMFPTNALAVFFALYGVNMDSINAKYGELKKNALEVAEVSKPVFGTIRAEAGKLATNLALAADAGGLFTDTMRTGLTAINALVEKAAQGTSFLGNSAQVAFFVLTGQMEKAEQAAIGVTQSVMDFFGLTSQTRQRTLTEAWQSVEASLLGAGTAVKEAAKDEGKLTDAQQLELDLSRGIEVSLERQLEIRRQILRDATRVGTTKFLTDEDKAKAATEEIKRRNELEQGALAGIQEANRALLLQSDELVESHRRQGAISFQFAEQEIRSRRGILAALQQEQAAVLRSIELKDISRRAGEKELDQLQRQINTQLQLMRQVEEAARTDERKRRDAIRKERDAGESLADLQVKQAEQRTDAETTIRKARERVVKDTRQLEEQQRKSLETQALGRVRLLLGFPEQANELLLVQLDRIRQAQEFANLPLREREQLLRQEFALLEKLKGKEEERLDQEILFGKDFAGIVDAQRRAVEGFLASDPVRRAAAERKAKLKFGRVTPEGVLAAGGEALGIRGLVPETAEEERRNLREIEGMGGRRVELEKVIRGQLDEELQRSKELERERHEAIAEANVALDKALRDQADLLRKQPIEMRKATESLQDAQQERLRIEAQFTNSMVQSIQERKAAIAAAEAAGTATRRDVATDDLTEEERLRRIRDVTEVMRQVGRRDVPGTEEFEQFQRFRDEAIRQQQQFIQPERPRVFLQSFQFQESLETPIIRAEAAMGKLQERIDQIEQRLPAVMARTGKAITNAVSDQIANDLSRELLFPTGDA
jgi:hypothetical protein